jgi:hypothetical protein
MKDVATFTSEVDDAQAGNIHSIPPQTPPLRIPSKQVQSLQTNPSFGVLMQFSPDASSSSQVPASAAFAAIMDVSQELS